MTKENDYLMRYGSKPNLEPLYDAPVGSVMRLTGPQHNLGLFLWKKKYNGWQRISISRGLEVGNAFEESSFDQYGVEFEFLTPLEVLTLCTKPNKGLP